MPTLSGQPLLPGDHHCQPAVLPAVLGKAGGKMGLPGGDLLSGELKVIVDAADFTDPEGVVQQQFQGGYSVPLSPVGA